MSSEAPARLGELRRVTNTKVQVNLEAEELIVGHIMLDDTIMSVAFTESDLERPLRRADKNKEDIGQLAVKPPTWDEVADQKSEIAQLRAEREALIGRGLWQRILNVIPVVGDKPGNEE